MAKPRTRKTSADEITPATDAPADAEHPIEAIEAAPDAPVETAVETVEEAAPISDAPVVLGEPNSQDTIPDAPDAPPAAPAQPKPAATVKKIGFMPVVLGGVIAAGLGAGAAIYALPQIPAQFLPASLQPAPPVDTAPLTAAIAEQSARADALEAALAALPTPSAPVDLAPIEGALAAANDKIAALGAQVSAVESQMAALGDRALQSDPAAAAAMQQVQAEIAQMKALIDEGRDTSSAAKAQIEAAAEEAAARISGAETEAAKLRADAEQDAANARAKAAIAQLANAIATGVEKDAALAALTETGVGIPAALSAAVPSLTELKDGFDVAARDALGVSRKATAGEGALDKIGAFLIAQTGVRSLTPQEGDDPDAVLSRAGAAIDAGALGDALTEIAKLPPEGQEAMAAWAAMAQAHIAATDALGQLAQTLN